MSVLPVRDVDLAGMTGRVLIEQSGNSWLATWACPRCEAKWSGFFPSSNEAGAVGVAEVEAHHAERHP
jgi:hypothetical protein